MNDLGAFSPWKGDAKGAIDLQKKLRDRIVLSPLAKRPEFIAGADVSFNRFSDTLYAGILVLKFPELTVVERALAKVDTDFPYIPGLLSFREIPALLAAWKKLKRKPDLVMVDGIGIAHPRRLGIASHFGLIADVPTIGCAKSILYGKLPAEPGLAPGSMEFLLDPKHPDYPGKESAIGAAIRTKLRSKPMYISPGYMVTLEEAIELAKECVRGYRLPEPTRLTHELVNAFRRGEIN